MSEHTNLKNLAPLGNQPDPAANSAGAGPSKPFTEAQVEEFREQDRWLPVSIQSSVVPNVCFVSLNSVAIDCERGTHHEVFITNFCQSVEGSQGMCPRMRVGIYFIYRMSLPPLHYRGSKIMRSLLQTSEAAEKCLNEKRKTLNGEDILTSMRALGFDNYEGVLRVYLAKYRDVSGYNLQHKACE